MSAVTQYFDVIIVGAGAIGATAALKLARAFPTANFAILERSKPLTAKLGANQRVWALGHAAIQLLQELQLFTELPLSACHPYQCMVVWDENSDGELRFDAQEFDQSALGYMVDADQCTIALQAALAKQSNLSVMFERRPRSLAWQDKRVNLALENETLSADLVVAADGAQSWVRKQAKILAPTQTYHQRGLVARIRSQETHANTAWQRFLSTGPVAVLPLAENYSSIVWSTSQSCATDLLNCSKHDFELELEDALDRRLGSIELCSERASFPLQSRQAEEYYRQGLVLIGDAAHTIHPLAGQGANLGFRDVISLHDVFSSGAEFGDRAALAEYQRVRRPENLQADLLMTSLHHAYRTDLPGWSLLRGEGMNLISRSASIKQWLGRQAMGL